MEKGLERLIASSSSVAAGRDTVGAGCRRKIFEIRVTYYTVTGAYTSRRKRIDRV